MPRKKKKEDEGLKLSKSPRGSYNELVKMEQKLTRTQKTMPKSVPAPQIGARDAYRFFADKYGVTQKAVKSALNGANFGDKTKDKLRESKLGQGSLAQYVNRSLGNLEKK